MRASGVKITGVLLLIFLFSLPCAKAENLKGKIELSGGLGPCIGITGIADPAIGKGGIHLGGGLEYFPTNNISLGVSYAWNGFPRSKIVAMPDFTSDFEVGWSDYSWHSFGVFGKLFLRENIKSAPYFKTEVTFNRPRLNEHSDAKFGFNGGAGYHFAGTDTGTFFTELIFNSVFKKKTLTYFTLSAGICFYLN